MSVVERRAESLRSRVELLLVEQQSWKSDADTLPREPFAWREAAADALELYESLCRLDEHWHLSVFRDPEIYNDRTAEGLLALFGDWLGSARLIANSENQEQSDTVLPGRLRDRIEQCEALLQPADEESSLADEALVDNRTGLATEV